MWFFNSPQIVFGEDALSWLSTITGERAFLVTDQTILRLGFVQRAIDYLESVNIKCAYFAEVEPDPSLATVIRCAQEMALFQPDWVIGLGGGSCLDAAKGAWFTYERPDIDLKTINPMESFGLRKRARLISIPTTSGTGSDVSWGFALADLEQREKLVRVSRELVPDIAIVDPVFVRDLPPQITADTGMDVLSHAIEGYTSTWHNDFSDGLCLKAIQLVFEFLPRAYQNGSDLEARERMHNAATIAGLGFSNTAIILAHALAHAVAGYFHLSHGRVVGVFLPFSIEYNARVSGERYAEICRFINLPGQQPALAGTSLATAIRSLAVRIDQPVSLREAGISWEDYQAALPKMMDYAICAPEIVATPRLPYDEDLKKLFTYAYDGRSIDF